MYDIKKKKEREGELFKQTLYLYLLIVERIIMNTEVYLHFQIFDFLIRSNMVTKLFSVKIFPNYHDEK